MMEATVTVRLEAPELAGAISALADALKGPVDINVSGPDVAQAVMNAPDPAPAVPESTTPAEQEAPAPVPTPTPVESATPATVAPSVTLEQLSHAGAALASSGKMPDLMALMKQHGVQAITQLKPEQYEDVAESLRAMGAQI